MKRTILIVDDEMNMLTVMRMVLEDAGYAVLAANSGEEATRHLSNPNLDVIVTDLKMPSMTGEQLIERARKERGDVPVVVVTAHGTIKSAVNSIHAGASDYLSKPFEPEELEIAVHNALRLRDILRENEQLKAVVTQSVLHKRVVGHGPAITKLFEEIKSAAPYKTNVLITGESGSGKEVVARTIHDLSPRCDKPWVAINCAAIPRDLLESELFGYVKGAFTGATQNRAGRLEQAQNGTLFLDEIGDMDLALQAKLLRVLQEREYSPVGSDVVRKVDVRFIAATNRDLKAMAAEGKFREDLYYRLDVYHIQVPPLRERREDIPLLAETFLSELVVEIDKPVRGFTRAAMDALSQHYWPGNVREMRNAVERALLFCRGDKIDSSDLPHTVTGSAAPKPPAPPVAADTQAVHDLDGWLEDLERRAILNALEFTKGVQAQAAKRLGITERSLWHRVKKLDIQISRTAG